MTVPMHESRLDHVDLSRGGTPVLKDITVAIPPGSFTVIIGPNGCGKSSMLLTLARILFVDAGKALIDGRDVKEIPARAFARQVGLLPQSSVAPDGITIAELVGCGRFPYQSPFRQWSKEDERAVIEALEATGCREMAQRRVAELSGGQRQRAWIAMVLAQETPVLFLDEPTSALDIAHQIEVMSLLERLNSQRGQTIAVVLHDLNQASRFATHMIAMKDGRVVATGAPSEIVTPELVREIYGIDCIVISDPVAGTPMIVPRGGRRDTADLPDHRSVLRQGKDA